MTSGDPTEAARPTRIPPQEIVVAADLRSASCTLVAVHHGLGVGARPLSAITVDFTRSDRSRVLRDWRRSLRFDGDLRLVVWPRIGDDGASPLDEPPGSGKMRLTAAALRTRVRPLVRAGFRVRSVMWPAQAIAALMVELGRSRGVVLVLTAEAACITGIRDSRVAEARYVTYPARVTTAFDDGSALPRYQFAARLAPYLGDLLGQTVAGEPLYLFGALPNLHIVAVPFIEEFDRDVEVFESGFVGASGIDIASVPAPAQLAWAAALPMAAPAGAASWGRRWWFTRSAAAL